MNKENKKEKINSLKEIKAEGTKLNQGIGKIFVIGSSDIITDSIIDEQGDTPNSIFIMNIIDVLNENISLVFPSPNLSCSL